MVLRDFDAAPADQRRYAYEAAVIHATLGDADTAFARLHHAQAARSAWMPYLGVDPRFDTLRGDPRHAALIDALGLAGPNSVRTPAVVHGGLTRQRSGR